MFFSLFHLPGLFLHHPAKNIYVRSCDFSIIFFYNLSDFLILFCCSPCFFQFQFGQQFFSFCCNSFLRSSIFCRSLCTFSNCSCKLIFLLLFLVFCAKKEHPLYGCSTLNNIRRRWCIGESPIGFWHGLFFFLWFLISPLV